MGLFGAEKSSISLSVDSTSKPFWTTGDVLSGSVRLVTEEAVTLSGISVVLECKERAIVTDDEKHREKNSKKKKGGIIRTKSKDITHISINKAVVESPGTNKEIALERGEYVFPFAIEILEDTETCPSHAPVTSRNGYEVGVRWSLKAMARRTNILAPNIKTELLVPVFTRSPQNVDVLPSTSQSVTELSGVDVVQSKGGLFASKSDKYKGRLLAQLTFPGKQIAQRPKLTPFSLKMIAELEEVQVHNITVSMVQRCDVNARGASDTYLTRLPLGSVTVTRRFKGPVDLSALLSGFVMPQILAPAFRSQLVAITYELELSVEYSMPGIAKQASKLRTLTISTPVELAAPWSQWVGRGVAQANYSAGGRQVQFDDASKGGSLGKAQSIMTGRSGNTHSTHLSTFSGASSGTYNSYSHEIVTPQEAFNNFVGRWTGAN